MVNDANRKRSAILALAAAALLMTAPPAVAQGWHYDAAAYAWLMGMDGTIGLSPIGTGQPVDASFSDLAGFLDFAAAGHFEATNPRVVFLGDVNYAKLGASRDAEIGSETVSVDMDYTQWILEAGGGYRVSEVFDLLLVGRYYIQDLGTTAEGIVGDDSGGTTYNWGDIYVGARWTQPLGSRWWFSVRGDIGAGGSDFAWLGNAAIGYRFSDLFTVGVAYQILSLDYQTGSGADYYKWDVALNGLGLILGFTF
jgi:hypothetical protein